MRRIDQRAGQSFIVEMDGNPAAVADQEDAIMLAAGMAVGDIGIGAFHPPRQIAAHEQIEDAVNAVRRHALAAPPRDIFRNIIGRGRLGLRHQRIEHISAHLGPLLARFGKRSPRGRDQSGAGMFEMFVSTHRATIAAA